MIDLSSNIKGRIFHLISNTHWDREWRFPFEKNRQMLVEMIDEVLRILESNPAYRAFHLDSQTIVLNDYLEIKPQNRERIVKLVKENRLLIGPWLVLPEEFQVGGENLIRNLLAGHTIAGEFGHIMKVGYSPFSWGQISQLPQIYAGFGIDVIMFYRGVNSIDSKHAEFIWEGPDGTKTLTSRFSTMPRYNFYFYIYRPVVHNEKFADVEYPWSRGGVPFHAADRHSHHDDYYILSPVDEYHKENIVPSVEAIVRDQVNDFTTPHVFWAEGHDSSGPNDKTPRIAADIRELLPDVNVEHSTLEEYAKGLLDSADRASLPVVRGERRSSQFDRRSGNMYGYTTSARMYLKQMNFEAERWLQFYAEPFNAFAGMAGMDINDRSLDRAWYLLMQNSAHDSIGGCSLDDIHSDMDIRYKNAIEISRSIFEKSIKYLSRSIDLSASPKEAIHLIVFNPSASTRSEIVEAFVDVPRSVDTGNIRFLNLRKETVPMQMIESYPADQALEQMIDRPMYFAMQRYRCFMQAQNIPALGYSALQIEPVEKNKAAKVKPIGKKIKGRPALENEFLQVTVNANGTLNILCKETGDLYRDTAYFQDEGEAGHAWVNTKIKPFLSTLRSRPKISFGVNGELAAFCTVSYNFRIPAGLDQKLRRSKAAVVLPIQLMISLKKNSRRLECGIEMDNKAESHRLRLMFPTGIAADYSFGEGQFDVAARSWHRPDTKEWIEQPMYDYPMHQFVDVNDGKKGFALLVDGLKEYELLPDRKRTLALTLLRGFRYIIQPSSVQDYSDQKGSQCLGRQAFRLAIYLHSGGWEEGGVYTEALSFNNEIRLAQVGRSTGTLPAESSFLEIQPKELVFSCLKAAENKKPKTFILRIYNPTEKIVTGTVKTYFPLRSASIVSLEEKFIESLPLEDSGSFSITAAGKKIVTLELVMQ